MVSWPEFGVFSVTPGAIVAMPCRLRGVASASISGCSRLMPTCVVVTVNGVVSAVTVTRSVTAATRNCASTSTVVPTPTSTIRPAVVIPGSSTRMPYTPAGRPRIR